MKAEKFAREVMELLVFEVVNLRAPLGVKRERMQELERFAKDFCDDHRELVEAAFKAERERAELKDLDFNIEKFMQAIEPEILKLAPDWLAEHPQPLY